MTLRSMKRELYAYPSALKRLNFSHYATAVLHHKEYLHWLIT